MMQRMIVGVPSVNELDAHERLRAMCDMFTREFAAKVWAHRRDPLRRFFTVINVSIYDIDFAALFHSEIVSKT